MLATILKQLREQQKLTKKQVAVSIGITERAYIAYEYGERDVSTLTLSKLADFYGVTTDYLLGRETGIEIPFDEFLKKQEVTELEVEFVKNFFKLDKNVRTELLQNLKNFFQ